MLNNIRVQGGHRPTRYIGATEESEHDIILLSTFYAKMVSGRICRAKGCRLPGRNPAVLSLILTFSGRHSKLTALANFIRSQWWYPRDAGFRARTSAPFCVDK
ncbi:hypothetical protein, partial [Desulfuromonas acetoxidans]|uniref:hypothetical protein n=1 Tax=Desulfuromonas acetoxidans TaxID=891 RepID=UPI001A7E5FA2